METFSIFNEFSTKAKKLRCDGISFMSGHDDIESCFFSCVEIVLNPKELRLIPYI